MQKIKSKDVMTAFLCLVLFSLFLMASFFRWIFAIPAILFLIFYFVIDRKYLRCPNCSGFTNLDRLLYAKEHIYYCSHCGKIIDIEK